MEPSDPAAPGDPTGLTDSATPDAPGVSGRPGLPETPEGTGAEALVARAGVDGRRLRSALAALGGGRWWTLADLVRETATSRRTVEALLREVDGELERSGDRFRLPAPPAWLDPARQENGSPPTGPRVSGPGVSGRTPTDPGVTGPPPAGPRVTDPTPAGAGAHPLGPADPVAHLLPGHADLVARMDELIAKAPRGRHTLDHVAATGETVVRRALLLDARFWLDGARLLCVGDHDLTSLATAMLHPGVEVTVVDVDERILAYIAGEADRLGLAVRTRWADLRLGLPASARSWADLAITDPPYTPEGVGLFVARCAEGLRDREQGRIMLAYGASERTPALALKVQQALSQLNLVNEAIYPDFNRYLGAEAIGSAADLYVLRPTTKTWPAAAARAEAPGTAIYTQGPQSVESAASPTAPTADSGDGFVPEVLVGDWPRDVLPKAPRARLTTWLAKPYASDPTKVAISVPAGLEAALPRLLLATRAEEVRVTLASAPKDLPADLLAPVYDLTAEGTSVRAVRVAPPTGDSGNAGDTESTGNADDAARILRRVLDNAHGKLANTWREALIRVRGDLTKKQARAVVTAVAPWAGDVTVLELPAHRLLELRAAVESSLSAPADAG
ncbi:bis-aminopropyl spermidine synthase family protein [Streptosporangium sp. NBC_01495]|uniref:bis-aminopropyl spermidine synthase family protein n=1 Tax=Streptosporangium sp. NBC_01495 TaxID=2903899 RepID=UPI002E37FF00|nr:bis-aminopropyl spermidine synthase family protein [Streptosporangium sp. NBC_01495]